MPYKPSNQIKRLTGAIKRPNYGSSFSTCQVCSARVLLPRQHGNICRRCKKEREQKVIIDPETKKLMKQFNTQRRFRY